MSKIDSVRWDLGIRRLLPEWRALVSPRFLREDLISGLSLSLIAVPLSLAIALASGVPPATGLVTAIVAGVVAGLFGGAPLAVTGPAAAMAVLVASVVQTHGMLGLVVVTLGAGMLQVLTGVLGLGRVARLVPMPVIEGFTAGIGAIIFVGQLPRALGLSPASGPDVLEVVQHVVTHVHEVKPASLLIALATLALATSAPRLHPRAPGALLGVLIPSVAVALFGVETPLLGEVPSALPMPKLPEGGGSLSVLIGPTLIVYALASLESLLSAAAVDKLARGKRHDPDQEFIGQGLGNIASALFGGIPVTGVIARSALNVQAGGRTRRAAIVHAFLLAGAVLVLSRSLAQIPLAALAGLLLSVALRMLSPARFIGLYRVSRSDAIVYAVTFAVIVFVDLIEGVQWGIAAALVVVAVWSTEVHAQLHSLEAGGVHRLTLEGPHTFLSALKFEALQNEIALLPKRCAVVLDLVRVPYVDASGAERILEIVEALVGKEGDVLVLGMRPDVETLIRSLDHRGLVAPRIARSEADLSRLAPDGDPGLGRLSLGVASYRRVQRPRYTQLFQQLRSGQSPHTLFITCSDSRVVPSLLTASDPGELFIVRNVGNMIPTHDDVHAPAVTSAIEYAIGVLKVRDIVVCGHSGCGAIQALRDPDKIPEELGLLRRWLLDSGGHALCGNLPSAIGNDEVARMNALLQLEHLRSHPLVRTAVESGAVRLHAWFFLVGTGEIEEWDPAEETWRRDVIEAKAPAQDADARGRAATPAVEVPSL